MRMVAEARSSLRSITGRKAGPGPRMLVVHKSLGVADGRGALAPPPEKLALWLDYVRGLFR
jgi:hypothetical protein